MRITLRRLMYGTLMAMKKVKKDKWLKDWVSCICTIAIFVQNTQKIFCFYYNVSKAGMLLITTGLISWTADCTKALMDVEKGEKHAMRILKKRQIINLKKLADLVKSPLSKVERKKLIALITIEVHSRDVIDRMIKADCSSVNAFEWLSQLRFYWEKEGRDDEDW